MNEIRVQAALKLLKGVAAAAICTFPGMLLLAVTVVATPISDGTLLVLNQLLKALCVFAGTLAAVGAGGKRGFLTGAAVGAAYMLLGYGLYCAFDGSEAALKLLATEILAGAALGAISGAICANLKPRRGNKRRARAARPART